MSYIKEDLFLALFMPVSNYININQEYLEIQLTIMILIIWLVLLAGALMNNPNRSFGMLGIVGEHIGVKMVSLELLEVRTIYLSNKIVGTLCLLTIGPIQSILTIQSLVSSNTLSIYNWLVHLESSQIKINNNQNFNNNNRI
jgi:hypothetical protein